MADQVASSPRNNAAFRFEVQGLNTFLVQEVTTPDVNFTEISFGQPWPLPDAKTPGKLQVGDLVLRKIKPLESGQDTWIWDWMAAAFVLPNGNKRVGMLYELDNAGNVLDTYFCGLVWPKGVNGVNYVREGGGDKIMEECTFSVTHYLNIASSAFKGLLGI